MTATPAGVVVDGVRQPISEPAEMFDRSDGIRIIGVAPDLELLLGHRLGEVIALHQTAAETPHQVQLIGRLDAFGNHLAIDGLADAR